jgi:hypothetical protein
MSANSALLTPVRRVISMVMRVNTNTTTIPANGGSLISVDAAKQALGYTGCWE